MTWTASSSKIQPGDKVCFRTSYLFAQGLMRTTLPHISGTVTEIEGENAKIDWDSPHDQPSVPLAQLTRLKDRGLLE
jgi:hypothetical protein